MVASNQASGKAENNKTINLHGNYYTSVPIYGWKRAFVVVPNTCHTKIIALFQKNVFQID
jgi:hypothetical protein